MKVSEENDGLSDDWIDLGSEGDLLCNETNIAAETESSLSIGDLETADKTVCLTDYNNSGSDDLLVCSNVADSELTAWSGNDGSIIQALAIA